MLRSTSSPPGAELPIGIESATTTTVLNGGMYRGRVLLILPAIDMNFVRGGGLCFQLFRGMQLLVVGPRVSHQLDEQPLTILWSQSTKP